MSPKGAILFLVTCAALIDRITSIPDIIRIAGLFGDNEDELEAIFRFAVERVNEDKTLLPMTTLVAQVERVPHDNPYHVGKQICGLAQSGIAGIIGPTSEVTSFHVRSTCDALEIPHIELTPDLEYRHDALTINMHPRPESVARAFLDVARGQGWDHMAIAYDVNEGIVNFQDILKLASDLDWKVAIYQFDPDEPYREIFWKIKLSGETNIILDVKGADVHESLKQAQQVGLVTEKQNWIITSLDMMTDDLEDFYFSGCKIAGFRLVEDDNSDLTSLLQDWRYLNSKTGNVIRIPPPETLTTQGALVYDAVKLLASALEGLDKSQKIEINPISCEDEVPWTFGTSLVNYMRPIIFRGVSGLLTFNEFGHRTLFTLDILTLGKNGVEKVGYWNSNGGLNISKAWLDTYSTFAIQQRTLIVTTTLNDPFTMKKITATPLTGNAQYEGYAVDLIEELSTLIGFRYEIKIANDNKNGAEDPPGSGNWNGMVGELMRDEADVAVADLTITQSREKAVDFTLPFMNTGVSILFTKPKVETSLFGFLSPFTIKVWVYLLLCTALISAIFFVVGRLSPYEWSNPYPCREDEPILKNECSVKNSFWFTVGSLMQQGSDLAPGAMSTRVIASVWYFFVLILAASYTANLAAFLTIEDLRYPFTDAEELSQMSPAEISYGCTESGSTRSAFAESPNPILKKLSENMETNPSWFVTNNKDGKDRVKQGVKKKFALFMEGAAIEYAIERECDLTQIGGLLDSKGYGMATKRGSPLRYVLTNGILELQERGKLHILYERWWKQKRGGGLCSSGGGSAAAAPMALSNVGGVFVVLLLGSIFSFFIAACEFVYKTKLDAANQQEFWDDLKHDLKFCIKLHEYRKPTKKARSEAGSSAKSSKKSSRAEETALQVNLEKD
ncbi:Glutamate receptor ionotropic, kainate 3 [Halotydeus destructor]|nr:Glutamate receptor ionotropic, kainate 3 [Halotydeus destructor]